MKYTYYLLALVLSFSLSTNSLAHGDHDHHSAVPKKVSGRAAEYISKMHIKRLINEEKLAGTWSKAKLLKSEMKKTKKGKKSPEWQITYQNEKIKDEKKNKLYIFLSQFGKFIAANHSGK
ncbi:MAG: hypothetical protein HN509_01870 [Halobacteriovoraceae bacterium]|jgi:hypothetical protein|nr:hypothetical protein [Halobacteriovoraceae bacterium]MBT5094362.1 hypothetical protein [Halobacteriovoraceae bacterium]